MELTRATLNDWEKVGLIEKFASSKYYKAYETYQELTEYVTQSFVFFIMVDKETAGTISFNLREDGDAQMDGIIVLEKFQNRGIATNALTELIIIAKNKGCKKIHLFVHPNNKVALDFYIKKGFKEYDKKDNFYGDGEPRLLMSVLI